MVIKIKVLQLTNKIQIRIIKFEKIEIGTKLFVNIFKIIKNLKKN